MCLNGDKINNSFFRLLKPKMMAELCSEYGSTSIWLSRSLVMDVMATSIS